MSLLENPSVYDAIQVLSGRHVAHRWLRRALALTGSRTVLDVGAGTGSLARLLPSDTTYWALDNDPAKLERLLVKVPGAHCLQQSALDIGLPDRAVDWTVCVAVSHHLDDEELPRLFAELARVTRERLVFFDAVQASKWDLSSRLLWRYDGGSHPRPAETLLSALKRHFNVERVERFRWLHKYLLCSGPPVRE
jgi:SAM-dependent methyltransferase